MSKTFSRLASAAAILSLACLGAVPAVSLGAVPAVSLGDVSAPGPSLVTFVSGTGIDSGTCASPANPCRSFQFAINQTSASGEVKALAPGHYGGMVIVRSISITGVEGAGINRISGDAITVNAGANDKFNFSHLIVDGIGIAHNGIVFNSGGSLTISHCVVRNFQAGLVIQPSTGITRLLIGDTLISDNANGLFVAPQGSGAVQGILDHVSAKNNSKPA